MDTAPIELKLVIQPKVIDHLGIKMYQKPVDVVSEFIANSWDADSEKVQVYITDDTIRVIDDGIGMTTSQCQDFFLTVGRDRRIASGTDLTESKHRPVIGRKGIGKFAGFGIAEQIEIDTTSLETGEHTGFCMDIRRILDFDEANINEKPINVTIYEAADQSRRNSHGTIISLRGLNNCGLDIDEFKAELSRRFLLAQLYDDFVITVNDLELPESFSDQMEFVFPRDLNPDEKLKLPLIVGEEHGWAIETFYEYQIQWRIGFYENTIQVEELRGVAIYAKGKLAQKPFFFDLSGGISAQHGLEYMTGQIRMDFIDEGENNLIATERQRINLQTELGKKIREWGIERTKLLSSFWKDRRSKKRLEEINNKISGFGVRLNRLPRTERATVESVLRKIATFPRLGQARFNEWCSDILTSWEIGRLRNLISEISETEDLDEQKLLDFLSEAGVLTAINIAESIKTKILTIGELKQKVDSQQLENSVRDFIYENPWLIHPKWEGYRKERGVLGLISDLGKKNLDGLDAFHGRVDLALCAGSNLLIIEFMRPGLTLDRDHLDRIAWYFTDIKNALESETGNPINTVEKAYVIADNVAVNPSIRSRVDRFVSENILVMTWKTLINQAIAQWEEHLQLLKERYPDDLRIQNL